MNKSIFIVELTVDIHESGSCYICEAKNIEEYNFIMDVINTTQQETNAIKYVQFDSFDEAITFMDKYKLRRFKKYTELINKEGIPLHISKNCRHIIAFIDENLVQFPGWYNISLRDYMTLRNTYGNYITLAKLEELKCMTQIKDVIIFRDFVYKACPTLFVDDLASLINDWVVPK